MKRWLCFLMAVFLAISLLGCGGGDSSGAEDPATPSNPSAPGGEADLSEAVVITLNGSAAGRGDGTPVKSYDYVWHITHDAVDGTGADAAPHEHYTGTAPNGEEIYIARDIRYFPQLDSGSFERFDYDGETEWGFKYTAPGWTDYYFATLPTEGYGDALPTSMMHSAEDAYNNPVLHITKAGTYVLTGTWNGQILVDLGDGAGKDEDAKVTLVLSGVTVRCAVAPALAFSKNVYECGPEKNASHLVDTSNAGVNIIIADDTTNSFTGTNVYRILRPVWKTPDKSGVKQQKFLKIDGAFYSCRSMNVAGGAKGNGVLNINSEYEGLNTELHMTINGGVINIKAANDGINANEDDRSVVTINGGVLDVASNLAGDGIDSNGWIVVNGGTITSISSGGAESGFDSERGTYVFGGTITTDRIDHLHQEGGTITYVNGGNGAPGRDNPPGGGPGGNPPGGGGGTPPDGPGRTPPNMSGGVTGLSGV